MIDDLERRLDALCESLEAQKAEYEETTKCCVEAMYGISQRLERIEKWMLENQKIKAHTTDELKQIQIRPLNQ